MAGDRLFKWAEQAIRTVDGPGESTARIRLITNDGSTWQTWDAPFESPEEWAEEAAAVCSSLAEDFAGEQNAIFVAETATGITRTQLPRRIQGRQKGRNGFNSVGGSAGSSPLHDMYAAQSKTVDRTLQSANVQLEVLTRSIETQAKYNAELLGFIQATNEQQAMAKQAESSDVQQVLGQLMEQAPLLLELLKQRKAQPAPTASPGVGQAIAQGLKSTATDAVSAAVQTGVAQAAAGLTKV